MRMKLNKKGQLILVSAVSLLAASLVTACGTLTIDFVFVSSAKAAGSYNYGEIDVFEINSESGYMRQIPTSPFPSGGRLPVSEALSSDNSNLYVVNQDDNTIVQFTIGSDGKLYPQNTTNTPGLLPLKAAVSGSYLFVLDTYKPLATCTTSAPCSGAIGVLPIDSSGALGTAVSNGSLTYWPLSVSGSSDIILPTGETVTANGSYLYVTAYDTTAKTGYVFGYSIGSTGALTALTGSPWAVGTYPSALARDINSAYLYVTDQTASKIYSYTIGSAGALTLKNSASTGSKPSALAVDSAANWIYVTNATDSTVSAYSVSSGVLSSVGTYGTGLQPVAIGIDPARHHFVYTVNYLGPNVSGFEINSDGSLYGSQDSPYTANSLPTDVVAISHH